VLIPVLDEAPRLARLLPGLAGELGLGADDEIVLADGGSTDDGPAIARRHGLRVVVSPPGRGVQLEAAARAARGDVLLVLHVDTRLPEGAVDRVREAIAGGAEGGAFLLDFDSPRRIFRLAAWLINRRTRSTLLPLGDQAQFVRRTVLEEMGGFAPWPILEDLDLARRLRHRGRLVILTRRVVTSARRFEARGVVRTVATNWLIWLLYAAGVSPHRLARLYRQVR
jgi:rSAM/selenodomain-associated transferase 2